MSRPHSGPLEGVGGLFRVLRLAGGVGGIDQVVEEADRRHGGENPGGVRRRAIRHLETRSFMLLAGSWTSILPNRLGAVARLFR